MAEDGVVVEDAPVGEFLGVETGVDEELDEDEGAAAETDEAGLIG